MWLTVNAQAFEVDEHDPVRTVAQRVFTALALERTPAPGGWLFASDDGAVFTQRPFDEAQPLGDFLRPTGSRALLLAPQTTCMHGSPAVPSRGFLCGWC